MRRATFAWVVAGAMVAGGPALAADAPADRAGPGADQIQFAAHEHDVGYRAYVGKQYEEAATHFENAFFAAPNPAELRFAIRAHREAKHQARAATLAAIGQRKFPDDAAIAKLATDTISEARPTVFELQIESEDGFRLAIDDKIVAFEPFKSVRAFTGPGKHEILVSWADDRSKRFMVEAAPGGTQRMIVEAPAVQATPPAPTPAPVPTPPPAPLPAATNPPPSPLPPAPPPEEPPRKPLPPVVFIVAAGLTAASTAFTVWSGIDTQNNPGKDAVRSACMGLGESCSTYQQGLSNQLRTNVALAVTGVLGVATAGIGIFYTDWSARERGHAARATPRITPFVGLGAAGLLGTF
jgi:hypothetical protein